mmetsp:Transcript_331/g.1027  ORF Transcript_331/g.1027 Transcript_331/m.1027 type:complete len:320 (+) Transcript_331:147-1106(+)
MVPPSLELGSQLDSVRNFLAHVAGRALARAPLLYALRPLRGPLQIEVGGMRLVAEVHLSGLRRVRSRAFNLRPLSPLVVRGDGYRKRRDGQCRLPHPVIIGASLSRTHVVGIPGTNTRVIIAGSYRRHKMLASGPKALHDGVPLGSGRAMREAISRKVGVRAVDPRLNQEVIVPFIDVQTQKHCIGISPAQTSEHTSPLGTCRISALLVVARVLKRDIIQKDERPATCGVAPPHSRVLAVSARKVAEIVDDGSGRTPTIRLQVPAHTHSCARCCLEHCGHPLIRRNTLRVPRDIGTLLAPPREHHRVDAGARELAHLLS